MSLLNNAKKSDLLRLAVELNVEVNDSDPHIDVLVAILKSKNYNEELANGILNDIQEERKIETEERQKKEQAQLKKEEAQLKKEEDERQFKILQIKKEEDERQFKILQLKYDEEDRKRKHELELKRLESAENISKSPSNPKILEWQRQLRNFELGNDFTLYLVHFERVMKSVGMDSAQWINCLLSALPTEIVEIIMREPEEKTQDYFYVKELLLKRYKLSPEKFRQLFYSHEFNCGNWREYYHQLESFFNGWISGLKIKTFDELKDLIISDRIKKAAPAAVQEYLMGEWMFLNSPLDLVTKMDEFDELNSLFKQRKSNVSKQVVTKDYESDSNSKIQCYNCYGEGHISRDCLMPRRPKFCTACNTEGHGKKDCTNVIQNAVNLSVSNAFNEYACSKMIMINGVESEAILDTGADISIMKCSFMKTLGSNYETLQRCAGFPIRGMGGVVQTFGTCLVNVAIDKVFLKNVQFFIVADNSFAGPNVLIGKNLIDCPGVVLIRKRGESTLLHKNEFKELYNLEVDPTEERVTFKTPKSSNYDKDKANQILVTKVMNSKNFKMYETEKTRRSPDVASSPYRASYYDRNIMKKQVQEMKDPAYVDFPRYPNEEVSYCSNALNSIENPVENLLYTSSKDKSTFINAQVKMKSNYDKNRCAGYKYSVGDVVVQRLPELSFGSRKTRAKYRGPMIATKVLPSDVYQVEDFRKQGQGRNRKTYETTTYAASFGTFPYCRRRGTEYGR